MRSKKLVSISMMVVCFCLLFTSSIFAASNQVDIFIPDPNIVVDSNDAGANYPRLIRLNHSGSANGTLLATFEQSPGNTGNKPVFPIYRSTDDGKTWTHLSDIVDTQNNWGMVWQPQLFEMPQTIGNVPAGTILAAGYSVQFGSNWAHRYGKIDLYRSDDHGLTWQFMSNIAQAGDYDHPIWEPFFAIDNYGNLVCYYSDERQHELHSQKLVHQVSTDGGYTWGPVVEDVALADSSLRPGMPVVTKMGNGQYMMVYEVVGMNANPIHFRFSNDGVNWGDPLNVGTKLTSVDGVTPGSSPYVVWSPVGGPKGTLIVSGKFQVPLSSRGSDYFVNYNYGIGPWYRMQGPLTYTSNNMTGYSHSMALSPDGQSIYHINNIDLPGTNKSRITFEKTTLQVGPGYSYKLVNKNSIKPMAVSGGSMENGTDVIQWPDTYGTDQNWYLINAGNGYYGIINTKSNQALSMGSGWTGDGGNAIQWPYYSGDEQLWTLELQTNGFYKIKNKNSGRYLNVNQGSIANGAQIGQLANNESASQEWQIQFTDVLPSNTILNKIQNPSFEADQAWTASPASWTTWTNSTNASYVETVGGAHSGNWHGTHWKNTSYKAYTYQSFTGLANGTYTLRAYVKGSGGQNQAWMSAKDFGSAELTANIPTSSYYTQITIPNINVTNGQITVGFWSDASANQWINFDDVEFFKN
ncbi:RICIN domain-containing protein [Paenibacillus harenae]|uniref:RICIN domain-containing protein n=1 Tax=Paenibacillus harenae TaxID=306543 RepID=UPI00278F7F5D|nr:RICIN domain-containing protein [Paenibacillus harenae]MDQ0061461.1 hypothetical protein [Paenibacillus harenae]